MQRAASICCRADAPPLGDELRAELAERLRALADPTRLGIVNRLAAADELCVCDLTECFGLSQPTISHHLRVLRDAGLVEGRRQGTWSYYRLDRDALGDLAAALTP
jgi:ArsR family transcriptional regulator, arsenate/arsenite/antimonite-responsive transcriptional repressor